MRLKSLFVSLIGLGVAGGAVYFAQNNLVPEPPPQTVSAAETTLVVIAARDIPFGTIIERNRLELIAWPTGSVPKGAFTRLSDVLPGPGAEPRRATRAFVEGEIVLAGKVSDYGEKVTIVQTLSENHRAMAVEVDAQSGVGGFVTPGDFVDIVLTQGRGEDMRAVTVLQNTRVVGVDQISDEEAEEPGVARTVTVEVTPVQGQKLALAQQAGRLSLSLRSLEGEEDQPIQAVRLSDILLDESPIADDAPKPVVRVRRGTEAIEEFQVRAEQADASDTVDASSAQVETQ